MKTTRRPQPSKITPLWVVASFLTLTEVVLGYAVTRVNGGVQIALAAFVISYAVLVAAAFFLILWNRPWVFYSPSEYGDIDPQKFLSALKSSPSVATHIELVKTVEENPGNQDAKFELIESMSDEVDTQLIILMHDLKKEVPRHMSYLYEDVSGRAGQGGFGPFGRGGRIEGTGLVKVAGNGAYWGLTEEGQKYAKWLIDKGRRYTYFSTPVGGWGTPKPDGFADKVIKEKNEKA